MHGLCTLLIIVTGARQASGFVAQATHSRIEAKDGAPRQLRSNAFWLGRSKLRMTMAGALARNHCWFQAPFHNLHPHKSCHHGSFSMQEKGRSPCPISCIQHHTLMQPRIQLTFRQDCSCSVVWMLFIRHWSQQLQSRWAVLDLMSASRFSTSFSSRTQTSLFFRHDAEDVHGLLQGGGEDCGPFGNPAPHRLLLQPRRMCATPGHDPW